MSRRGDPAHDENGLRLLASWREKGLPIIHVRHDSVEAESLFRPGMGWEMVMVADACDCMELPDAIGGGIIPAGESSAGCRRRA